MFTLLQGIHTLGLSLGPCLKENSFRPQDTWNSEAEFCFSTLEMHPLSQAAPKGVHWRQPQGLKYLPTQQPPEFKQPCQNRMDSVLYDSCKQAMGNGNLKALSHTAFKNRLQFPDSRAAQRIPALKIPEVKTENKGRKGGRERERKRETEKEWKNDKTLI